MPMGGGGARRRTKTKSQGNIARNANTMQHVMSACQTAQVCNSLSVAHLVGPALQVHGPTARPSLTWITAEAWGRRRTGRPAPVNLRHDISQPGHGTLAY